MYRMIMSIINKWRILPCVLGLKILPSKIVFGKSLYTFYIGQNDFTSNLASIGVERVKLYLPQVIGQIAGTIKVQTSPQGFWFIESSLL